ncbi:MAG: bifunctional riboflavin kinase/FAD synthetase [Clostridia bacterium]|nr:bifunctional riboflavin kinase/FAD synthetase [Clostridia bacterium]
MSILQIIYDFLNQPNPYPQPTAVALGTFDGLHPGHCRVIDAAVNAPGLVPAVFTFRDVPAASFGRHVPKLADDAEKARLLEERGVQAVFLVSFADVRYMQPEDFIDYLLLEKLNAKHVVCGFNFRFGAGGRGDIAMLRERCAAAGVTVEVVPPFELEGAPVSSSRIRACIEAGRVEEANRLLGRRFGYAYEVIHGRQLGRTIGVPTINQRMPEELVVPKFGVYATVVTCGDTEYLGVTNIGVKPTVGSDYVVSETWIPSFNGDLYGTSPRVELLSFIRPERKFARLEELQQEILENEKQARKIALQMGLAVL